MKKLWNMKVIVISIVIAALGIVTERIGKNIWGLENERTSGYHPKYIIVEIGQNTEKSPGDLRGLVVTQTLVNDL